MAMLPAAAPSPSPVRLRLVFDSSRLLRRAQRDDALRRCWLLLRPELTTVADLAAHVADRFRLGRSCPRGVVLSMDGFTLPPFEPTSIFRDKDIVSVKKKSCKNMIQHDVDCVQDPMTVEEWSHPTDDKILAIEHKMNANKHQEEQGGHQQYKNEIISHNIEHIDTSSKRKCQDGDTGIPGRSRKKKLKVTNPEMAVGVSKEEYKDQSRCKNLKSSSIDMMTEIATPRSHHNELNCGAKVADCDAQNNKKLESRSARRKKIKRRLRQEAKAQIEKIIQDESQTAVDFPSSSNLEGFSFPPGNQNGFCCPPRNQNDSHVPFSGQKIDEEESDSSEDIVPVMVRPGHIRFERAGGEQEKSPENGTQGTFQWSATMSKKKGQKWGMNNSNRKKTDINFDAGIIGSSTVVSYHVVDSNINDNCSCGVGNQKVGEGHNSTSVHTTADEEKSSGGPLDFEDLFPLTRLPKEGDLIAYRLVELSSSWCPELSSYRVGKVLIYDPISLRIILLPVPDYPISKDEKKN